MNFEPVNKPKKCHKVWVKLCDNFVTRGQLCDSLNVKVFYLKIFI